MVESHLLRSWVRLAPLAVFLSVGAVLLVGRRMLFDPVYPERPLLEVHMPAAASQTERAHRIQRAALCRYAIEHGALSTDPVVLGELARSFPAELRAGTLDPNGKLSRELVRIDPVLRERLAWHGEQLLRARVVIREPTDAMLESVRQRFAERYREPARFTLTHLSLSADRRGDGLASQLDTLLAALPEGSPEQLAQRFSDPSILPRRFVHASAADLDETFGPGFAAALRDVQVGQRSAPIRSSYGLHVVFMQARTPSTLPPLGAIRARVRVDYLQDARQAETDRAARALPGRYRLVLVEDRP